MIRNRLKKCCVQYWAIFYKRGQKGTKTNRKQKRLDNKTEPTTAFCRQSPTRRNECQRIATNCAKKKTEKYGFFIQNQPDNSACLNGDVRVLSFTRKNRRSEIESWRITRSTGNKQPPRACHKQGYRTDVPHSYPDQSWIAIPIQRPHPARSFLPT